MPGGRRKLGMGLAKGFDLPQMVGRSQYDHCKVSLIHSGNFANLFPRKALRPVINSHQRPERKGRGLEALGLQALTEALEIFQHLEKRLGQVGIFPDKRRQLHVSLLVPVRHKRSDQRRQQLGLIMRKHAFADSLRDEQRLVEPEFGRPHSVAGQLAVFIHISFGLKQAVVLEKRAPELLLGRVHLRE